jgi:hypothetical protein
MPQHQQIYSIMPSPLIRPLLLEAVVTTFIQPNAVALPVRRICEMCRQLAPIDSRRRVCSKCSAAPSTPPPSTATNASPDKRFAAITFRRWSTQNEI